MKIATEDSWYETVAVGDGVTHIWEPHIKPFYRCNLWHLRGRDRDLLIDSGMGVVSLREKVALVAERPLLAVASHASAPPWPPHDHDKRTLRCPSRRTRDRTLVGESPRERLREAYKVEINRLKDDLRRYREESGVHPNLRKEATR